MSSKSYIMHVALG